MLRENFSLDQSSIVQAFFVLTKTFQHLESLKPRLLEIYELLIQDFTTGKMENMNGGLIFNLTKFYAS